MNKREESEAFQTVLALIKCWKYIEMASLFDQLTIPMINLNFGEVKIEGGWLHREGT